MSDKQPVSVFWFRRDLRLPDNAGLYHALKGQHPVLPLFLFDADILDELENKADARVEFIHLAVSKVKRQLEDMGSSLLVRHGRPREVWRDLLADFDIRAVYTNHDYEPYARQRDAAVQTLLTEKGISFHSFKDHVILEAGEVVKKNGEPYTVFTPYSKTWRASLLSRLSKGSQSLADAYLLKTYPTENHFDHFLKTTPLPSPTLSEIGFQPAGIPFPPDEVSQGLIKNYDKTRDFPALDGTSRLGLHLRFGTISIREKARRASTLNDTFLNELIWRDFYAQILAWFPHVATGPFKKQYERIEWRDSPQDFDRWCKGLTGYPLVDAGMRQLNATGFMHNRVRMVAASFLSKHLLLNWQLGEAYFAEKLLDFDLASNSGGWQWAAGCGTDAAPYFRIFNPTEQARKFDPDGVYIRRWIPEYGTPAYPSPVVEHVFARERCLAAYRRALS